MSVVRVSLNGKDLGTCWKPPCRFDVSDNLQEGANDLRIHVTGSWRNRLIGEMREPQAFESASFRPHLAAVKDAKLHRDEALLPSGLIGPVRLIFSESILLKTP